MNRLFLPDAVSREDAAADLREHAASCRRLAWRARTVNGVHALKSAAEQFDRDALRLDLRSESR